ncbi:MAG: general secretion pathway protein GspK [Gemmatimonadetes bacterium]|nr:general secretion pathway protein GspK [Gemmatimonadota bacterium]
MRFIRPRDGFALVAALWLVVAISTVGLHIGTRARAQRLALANALEETRARAAADAGIEHARSRLKAVLGTDGPRLRGSALHETIATGRLDQLQHDTIILGEARYTVRIVDAGALLNLNRAGEEQLRRFLGALRVDWSDADRIAQSVADWRDADDLHRARGAERGHYLAARLPALPRNGPFETTAELRFVMGMTPAIFERVRPWITLEGPGLIDVNTAPEPVLRSLPGITQEGAALVLRRRSQGGRFHNTQELSDALSPIARQAFLAEMAGFLRLAAFDVTELLVESKGWVEGSPVRVRITAQLAPAGETVFVPWRRFQ